MTSKEGLNLVRFAVGNHEWTNTAVMETLETMILILLSNVDGAGVELLGSLLKRLRMNLILENVTLPIYGKVY